MRKQYHIRKVGDDTLIWDVDKLIKLSEHYLPKVVMLESIDELDENFWFKDKDDVPSVREIAKHIDYAKKTSFKYPVILSSDGRVMDGMHRILKALMSGKETIKVIQFLEDPEPDHKNVALKDLKY
ncbi:MAG: hypothetical protein ABJR05_06845 [Balneola sp.]